MLLPSREIEKGSSYREIEEIAESKVKNSFYGTVSMLISFNYDRMVEMLSENSKILIKILNQIVK